MRRVPLLPEELAGADEGRRVLELPAHDVAPLVKLEREISVRPDPLGERRVHDGLGRGTDSDRLVQLRLAGLGHPRDLGAEALDVILLGLEGLLGHKHREVAALHAELLDLCVEETLDDLPDRIRPRLEDVAPGDVVVVDHVTARDHITVPRREILVLLGRNSEQRLLLHILLPCCRLCLLLRRLRRLRCLRPSSSSSSSRGVGCRDVREVEDLGRVADSLEELEEVSTRDGGALVVVQRVEPQNRFVDQSLVQRKRALGLRVVHGSERRDRSLDDLENGEEKLVNSEAALGGSELLADGLHVMLR
mmetsp:Transcript_3892/g.9166  ORF Transcript_3892/g.9166 Transcript_3892/m.9166 type:complete len:306 (+) Transcript_3892:1190-2107(+)